MYGKLLIALLVAYVSGSDVIDLRCPDNAAAAAPFFPYPEDCTRFFECVNGKTTVYQCPAGLHFNRGYYVCDYPESAGCLTQAAEVPEVEAGECPEGVDLFPHPTDCALFYQCDQDEPELLSCDAGLHFNPTLHVCDYPENAGCVIEPPSTTEITTTAEVTTAPTEPSSAVPTVGPTTTETPSTEPSTDVTTAESPTGLYCPPDADLSYRPHPVNCDQFYQCLDGDAYVFTCQAGLYFNVTTQMCDYAESVDCTPGATVTAPSTTTIGTTTTSATSTPDTTDSTPPDDNEQCAPDADLSFYPHPTECNQFYACYLGQSTLLTCQEGLHFNPELEVCDYPDAAGCTAAP